MFIKLLWQGKRTNPINYQVNWLYMLSLKITLITNNYEQLETLTFGYLL